MNRIETIYSLIDTKDRVVDVGCDQAKLGILLSLRNQSSIAVDVSENVIQRAKQDIKTDLIDLRVSDGLSNVKDTEADTLVITGMGTHTIIDILENTNLKFKKIIIISNNYHDILRRKMNDLNYKVDSEIIIKEKNKYYNLIIFIEGNKKYSESELLLGVNHKDKELYNEYLNMLLNKYIDIKKQSKDKNLDIDKKISLIKERLSYE